MNEKIKYILGIILLIIGVELLIEALFLPKVYTPGSAQRPVGIAFINSLKSEFIALAVIFIVIGVLILWINKNKGKDKK